MSLIPIPPSAVSLALGQRAPTVTVTTAFTIPLNGGTVRANANTAGFAVTLPAAASSFVNGVGHIYTVKKIDSTTNAVTIAGADGATVSLSSQFSSVTVQSNGTNYDVIAKV